MADVGFIGFAADQLVGRLGENPQPDALEAQRMQALSLGVHIPIVCFGIAFPRRRSFSSTGSPCARATPPTYKALAKQWSKVALTLLAVGVVTGTILSFEVRPALARVHGELRRDLRHRLRPRRGYRRGSARPTRHSIWCRSDISWSRPSATSCAQDRTPVRCSGGAA